MNDSAHDARHKYEDDVPTASSVNKNYATLLLQNYIVLKSLYRPDSVPDALKAVIHKNDKQL